MFSRRKFRVGVLALLSVSCTVAICAIATNVDAAPEIILAEQQFDGGGHPFMGDGNIVGNQYELRGTGAAGPAQLSLFFDPLLNIPENVVEVIVAFVFTAESESGPLSATNTAGAQILWETSEGAFQLGDFTHDITPNGGDDTTFAGDDANNFFTGTFMISPGETKRLFTTDIDVQLASPTDVVRIDNFRIIGIIPEPAVAMLLVFGGGALLLHRRSRIA